MNMPARVHLSFDVSNPFPFPCVSLKSSRSNVADTEGVPGCHSLPFQTSVWPVVGTVLETGFPFNLPTTVAPCVPVTSPESAPVKLAPGQSVGDLLTFEAPAGDYEHLQLVVKLTALGQGERYLGFKLPKDMIAPERPRDVVAAAGQRAPMRRAGADAAGGEEEMKGEAAAAADAIKEAVKGLAKDMAKGGDPVGEAKPGEAKPTEEKPAAPKPAGEETILDLRKQIEESVKGAKAEKAKQRDMDKPNEEKPTEEKQDQ